MSESAIRIGVLAPEVLGTYGDSGNAIVLAQRARWRGLDAEIVSVSLGSAIPKDLDIYSLGGGEDTAQALAANHFRADAGLSAAINANKPVLAICASLQILGREYTGADGQRRPGLGLLDLVTVAGQTRAIGEVVARPLLTGLTELLTGFENHGGRTRLGGEAMPLGRVLVGEGNGFDQAEGAVQGSVVATYMHGPVLARNPELADYLLSQALGTELSELPMEPVELLRESRLRQIGV